MVNSAVYRYYGPTSHESYGVHSSLPTQKSRRQNKVAKSRLHLVDYWMHQCITLLLQCKAKSQDSARKMPNRPNAITKEMAPQKRRRCSSGKKTPSLSRASPSPHLPNPPRRRCALASCGGQASFGAPSAAAPSRARALHAHVLRDHVHECGA